MLLTKAHNYCFFQEEEKNTELFEKVNQIFMYKVNIRCDGGI